MMKKFSKVFILLSIIALTIGISYMLQLVVPMNIGIIEQETQTYNHNVTNILDNMFVEGNTKYLPFIAKNSEDYVSVNTIQSAFQRAGFTIQTISPTETAEDGENEIAVTNTKIVTTDGNEYTVLVYGDVNSDGYVDLVDAQRIYLHVKDAKKQLTDKNTLKAGNVANDEDTELDLIDAQRIFLLVRKNQKLVEVEPISSIMPDAKPVIELIGNQNVNITLGTSYTQYITKETAVKATNKYGGNITNDVVITHNIRNSAGTYEIKYDVIDDSGLKADTVTRVLTIKSNGGGGTVIPSQPTVTGIEITDYKNQYNYGELLDKSSIKIAVTYDITSYNKTIEATESGVSISEYSPSTPGEQSLTISYNGYSKVIKVTVLDKIKQIKLVDATSTTPDTASAITKLENVVDSELTLGKIVKAEGESTLQANQLSTKVIKVEEKLVDGVLGEVEEEVKDDKFTVSIDNSSLELKGTIKQSGNYKVYISLYGEEKIAVRVEVKSIVNSMEIKDVLGNNLTTLELTVKREENGHIILNHSEEKYKINFFDQYGELMEIKSQSTTQDNMSISKITSESQLVAGVGCIIPQVYRIKNDMPDTEGGLKDGLDISFYYVDGDGKTQISTDDMPVSQMTASVNQINRYNLDLTELAKRKLKFVAKQLDGTLKELCGLEIKINDLEAQN